MRKLVFLLALLDLFIGCAHNNKMEVIDDGLLKDPIICNFIFNYLSDDKLDRLTYFNLDITEKSDSLNILIYPIIQKSDSMGQHPLSMISYGKRIFFLRVFPSYYLNNSRSKTILKYRSVIRISPNLCEKYTQYPRWQIRIKNCSYRIDSLSGIPQLKESVKYVAPQLSVGGL